MRILKSSQSQVVVAGSFEDNFMIPNVVEWGVDDGTVDSEPGTVYSSETHGSCVLKRIANALLAA